MDAMVGRVLGHYELAARLGSGGMGTVYRGVHDALQQSRAVKILRPDLADEPDVVARFRREAMIAAGLRHPNIVLIYDVAEQDGLHYIVMDLLEGGSLRDTIRSSAPMSVERAVRLLEPLASALDYAHGRGVIHRDIKPGNVMVGADDRVTLVDFGIARAAEEARLTRSGTVVGTAEYMAPEAFTSAGTDRSGDLYAFGVIAYELLTGRAPFRGNPTTVSYAQVNTPPPPARSLNPGLSEAVERALLRQLAKDPTERFPDAKSFVEALAAAGQPDDVTDAPTIAAPRSAVPAIAPAPSTPASPRDVPLPPPPTPVPPTPEPSTVFAPAGSPDRSLLIRLAAFVAVVLAIVIGGSLAIFWATSSPSAVSQATPAATAQAPATAAPTTAPTLAQAATGTGAPAATAGATAQPVAEPTSPPTEAPAQTTASPTAIAGAKPTGPAVAASPSPAVAFEPVLDERFQTNQRGWPDNPESTAWFTNGVYHLFAREPNRFVSVGAPGLGSFGDVEVSGRFRKVGGPPGGGFGLIVRDQGPGPRDGVNQGGRYYVLEVGEGTQWGIWRREMDHWVDLVVWTESSVVKPPPEVNELTVRAIGPRLIFIVNGVQVADLVDPVLLEGQVGIYVAGDGNEVEAQQFVVRAPR